jgi:carbon monoxide dehydrogenase subunit G
LSLAIEESIVVGARPEAVWRLISDPVSWRFWWPKCRSAETVDRKPLREGSELVLVLELGLLPINWHAKVEVMQPNRALMLDGHGFGVRGRHAFYLEEKRNGTQVREREAFEGWGLIPFQLLGLAHGTSVMFKENLKGLRKMAERSL